MATISSTIHQTNSSAFAPENTQDREAVRANRTADRVAALAIALIATAVIAITALTLPFPVALTIGLVVGTVALAGICTHLSNCNSVTVVDGRPTRTYFWHHWRPNYYYTPPVVVNPVIRHSSPPVIIDRTPHVRVGGGHSSYISPIRTQPHIRVGGGHTPIPRTVFRSTPNVRVGGGHAFAPRSVPPVRAGGAAPHSSTIFGGRPHVAVGSRYR